MFDSEEEFMQSILTAPTELLENAMYLIECEIQRREDAEEDE